MAGEIIKNFYSELLISLSKELGKESVKGDDVDKILFEHVNLLLVQFIIEGKVIYFSSDLSLLRDQKEDFKNGLLREVDELNSNASAIVRSVNSIIDELHGILLQFINIVKSQLAVSSHIVHKSYSFIETRFPILKEFCEYCNLFILDLSISDDILFFEKLTELFRRFDDVHQATPFTYSTIYSHKINLLKYKWIKRQKYNREFLKGKIREDYSEKIVLNNEVVDLDSKIKIGEPFYQTYKEWIDKIEYHYFNKNSSEYSFVDDSLNKEEHLNAYDLYLRIKYCKDIVSDFKVLSELKKEFKHSTIQGQKNLLYYHNNLFSLYVQQDAVDYKSVRTEYLKLKEIFAKYSNNNFFIHYKFLEFVVTKFKDNIVSIPDELDFKELNEIVELCKSNFEWSSKGMNLVYAFSYDECLVNIGGISVYHASNFLLPLSLVENNHKIKDVESSLKVIEYERDRLRYENLFDKQKQNVDDKIEKVSKESINTITIFTAIISFIVGSVGVYKFIDSFLQALIFILVFGVSISIFVLLVFLNTKGIQKIKEHFKVIISIYTIAMLLILGLFFGMSFEKIVPTNTQKYLYKKQLDSISSVYQEDIIKLQEENRKTKAFYEQLKLKSEEELKQSKTTKNTVK
ncbi:hypothetical protein HXZ88_07275 [Myroides odoratimimus]|uniref:hypothetical protein n=1 Tax=Myroides odoratimimus TaxID=76832 RepID=UPI0025790A75|nr:hypothetical protein [Myroides odoratimimus]MDM1065419.1 hypothetical protein [Myroides odoratimimus]